MVAVSDGPLFGCLRKLSSTEYPGRQKEVVLISARALSHHAAWCFDPRPLVPALCPDRTPADPPDHR